MEKIIIDSFAISFIAIVLMLLANWAFNLRIGIISTKSRAFGVFLGFLVGNFIFRFIIMPIQNQG
jgi:hypothetical protein